MFYQRAIELLNSDGYDSDNSFNSFISSNSSNSSNLSNLSNLSNYTQTDSSDSSDLSNCSTSVSKVYTNGYYRRKRKDQTQTQTRKNTTNEFESYIGLNLFEKNIGYTSSLTKDTPFIQYLINKRILFCQLGAFSHIAAFVPVSSNFRECFKRYGKWKGRYG